MARRRRRSATRPTPRPARRPAPSGGNRDTLARTLDVSGPQARLACQQRLQAKFAAAAAEIRQRVDAGHEAWQALIGEPMPLAFDEIRAAAVRFGMPVADVLRGDFTLADVTTFMVGKRQAADDELHDRVRAAAAEAAVRRATGSSPTNVPTAGSTQAEAVDRRHRNAKRRQESDATTTLIAHLTKHHRYADESCLVQEPIESNELARLAKVSKSTASTFFKVKFKSHASYKTVCRDRVKLVSSLKMLNGEFAPHLLLGGRRADPGTTNHDE